MRTGEVDEGSVAAAPKLNAAPKDYDISPGVRSSLAKIFHLECDLYDFLKKRLVDQVTEAGVQLPNY